MSVVLSDYADVLQKRCIRVYGWRRDLAERVLTSYQQFLELKGALEDWDASVLSPSSLVDMMWHQHLLDNGHYNEYCKATFGGKVVCHDPDGGLDVAAREARLRSTELALKARYGSNQIDQEVWEFSSEAHDSPTRKRTKSDMSDAADEPGRPSRNRSLIVCVRWERPDRAPVELRIRQRDGGFSLWLYEECARKMKVDIGDILISYRDRDGSETVVGKSSPIETVVNSGNQLVCIHADPNVPTKVKVGDDAEPFEIRRTDRLHELYLAVAKRKGVQLGSFELICDGRDLNPLKTARCVQLFESTKVVYKSAENWDNSWTTSRKQLVIRVRDQRGEETHFKIREDTYMYYVFSAYCERKGTRGEGLRRFLSSLDGDRVYPYSTPRSLGMQDGDGLICFLEQCGC